VVALLLNPPTILIVVEALFVASTRSESGIQRRREVWNTLRPFMLSLVECYVQIAGSK
jgi:hypothetical protein